MKHEDDIVDTSPETPLPSNSRDYKARSYVGVTLGENLGIEFTTEASFENYDDYMEAMRVACEMLLQSYKQRLIMDSISQGAFIGAANLMNYSAGTKADELVGGELVVEAEGREEEAIGKSYS